MRKIEFATKVISWSARQSKAGNISALCLLALSEKNLTTEDIYRHLECFTRIEISNAIIGLHAEKYIKGKEFHHQKIGSASSLNKILKKGEQVVQKILSTTPNATKTPPSKVC
jgi:hypothetical protein